VHHAADINKHNRVKRSHGGDARSIANNWMGFLFWLIRGGEFSSFLDHISNFAPFSDEVIYR
jgi:hypothetical protein